MAVTRMAPDLLSPLISRVRDARSRTDALFELIVPEALYDRPISERHRLIFYLGHLEAFDWNLLSGSALDLPSHSPEFDRLFAFGIDPTNGALPDDQPADWPREAEVRKYNEDRRCRLDDAIVSRAANGTLPRALADGTLLHVAIEHRLMHAETLAYLLHQLPFDKKRKQVSVVSANSAVLRQRSVRIPEGIATLGQSHPSDIDATNRTSQEAAFPFGWDNEFESHAIEVPEFAIDAFPVTNGDFLKFVNAGGYDHSNLWSPEDWKWKSESGIRQPFFWIKDGNRWSQRNMFEAVPLPLESPVYVSHAEASAYVRWVGKSLPSEAQWHRAAYGTPQGTERLYPWGDASPDESRGNCDFARWDSDAVNAHPAGASAFGVHDLLGNGWEWTSTMFGPFPGFEPFSFYPGYSADFFDGQHYVMKGGSAQTAECFLRRPFRNWFQPHYPYVYATFRCVED